MKAQRRHDLKQNVLDTELAKGADYLKRHLNLIGGTALAAAIIALAVVGISRYIDSNRDTAQAEFDKAILVLGTEQAPDALQHIADGDGPRAAIASCKLADDYAAKTLMAENRQSPGEVNDLASKAKTYYTRVIEKFSDQHIQVANAHLGLGKLAESRGDLDTARKEYEAITTGRNVDGLPALTLAQEALAHLKTLNTNVYLAAGPAIPEPEENPFPSSATQPATSASPKDASTSQPAGSAPKIESGSDQGTTTRPAGSH
jgi:hypothetical protein